MFTIFVYIFVNMKIVYTSPPTYRLYRRCLVFLTKNLFIIVKKCHFSHFVSQKWRFFDLDNDKKWLYLRLKSQEAISNIYPTFESI